jgi:hypothetical protein
MPNTKYQIPNVVSVSVLPNANIPNTKYKNTKYQNLPYMVLLHMLVASSCPRQWRHPEKAWMRGLEEPCDANVCMPHDYIRDS